MKKALFLPIRPYYSYHIMIGDKLWEVRTYKLPTDIDIYGYVTKAKPLLCSPTFFGRKFFMLKDDITKYSFFDDLDDDELNILNGTIPFKFRVGKIIEVPYQEIMDNGYEDPRTYCYFYDEDNELLKGACLDEDELYAYGKGKTLYFHEITDLQIFDKPMVLGEFYGDFAFSDTDENGIEHNPIHIPLPMKRAPQKYQFVWVRE